MSTLHSGQVLNCSSHNKSHRQLAFALFKCNLQLSFIYMFFFFSKHIPAASKCNASSECLSSCSFHILIHLYSCPLLTHTHTLSLSFSRSILYGSQANFIQTKSFVSLLPCGKLLMKLQFELTLYMLVTDFYLISPTDATKYVCVANTHTHTHANSPI